VPVIVLALTVIAFNQIGDHLRSQLDSREGKI
jgi:ABC-type dipeptide/oligopeptide/nickel transport system permease subunit